MPPRVLVSEKGEFTDSEGHEIQLRGVNLDPSVKFPATPNCRSHDPLTPSFYDEAGSVCFINHPLKLEEVEHHICKLKSLGYNTIRYPFTWEALEHEGPGIYDYDFMDYTIEVLKKINKLKGIYIYLDPHQDVWSRFTGGSGAPLWTFYCAGFQPRHFSDTEATILQNSYINPSTGKEREPYPKMLWPTNYFRLAAQTMFTLFFGGKKFAPKCVINGQNIQDYLQDRFIDAVMTFYERIQQRAPELFIDRCILGLETMNEPNIGYFTDLDMSEVPKDRKLKRGTTPTAFQTFQLGEGLPAIVDTYDISVFGPRKTGTTLIDPKGKSAWLLAAERDNVDKRYNWQRGSEWEPGTCVWRLHGVWKRKGLRKPELLIADYFACDPATGAKVDLRYFINTLFLEHYEKFRTKYRDHDKDSYLFLQPPTLQEPPRLKGTSLIDEKTIYACHFYDGMSLMFKSWNKIYNVDTLGIMREKYSNPIFSVVLGENMIRKSFRKQLAQMKEEGKELLGGHVPVFFTEIGMPFDMDSKKAYQSGDFSSQVGALDALGYALEGGNLSYSLWCYCSQNSHEWGDCWNNEDFSIWSKDNVSSVPAARAIQQSGSDSESDVISSFSTIPHGHVSGLADSEEKHLCDYDGIRALDAILRPYPVKICGNFVNAEFELSRQEYRLTINAEPRPDNASGATLIFLPKFHFPMGQTIIKTTSGTFLYDPNQQLLKWSHDSGQQSISLRGEIESSKKPEDPEGCSVM
ncbi:LAME_0F08900g1_1 [Lachancea meyersii CBS 8951]|uniref:LAME_0F08900g1_1 n=1 Tax=Lachancea meyersii CBS 8951 TaxID=1266667 RepID=A0A1G4JV71_9SACH|nr:LAME_0F08900g1_1 [Lachancea meyersii CBS 8951]